MKIHYRQHKRKTQRVRHDILINPELLRMLELISEIDNQKISRVINRAIFFKRSDYEWEKTKREYKKNNNSNKGKSKIFKTTKTTNRQDFRSLFDGCY